MVYLRCLLNVIFGNVIKVFLICTLAITSSIFLANKEKGLDLIGLSGNNEFPRISFVTSLDGNFQDLKNKIIILPGVKLVEHKDSESIKDKISLLFKSDVLQEVISNGPGYNKFTIYFKNDVTIKSINLIKSYVIKILSGHEVYFGKVSGIKKKSKFDKNHLFYFVYGISILFLLSLYTIFEMNLRKLTYLFQRFQRGKGLPYKVSFLSFVTLVIAPSMIALFFAQGIEIKNIITILVPAFTFFFLINLKKYQWLN